MGGTHGRASNNTKGANMHDWLIDILDDLDHEGKEE